MRHAGAAAIAHRRRRGDGDASGVGDTSGNCIGFPQPHVALHVGFSNISEIIEAASEENQQLWKWIFALIFSMYLSHI